MTVTADDRRRVTLPDCQPGDRFEYSRDSAGRIVLCRVRPVPGSAETKARVVKLKRTKDGRVYVPGVRVSGEAVARVVREDRDSR